MSKLLNQFAPDFSIGKTLMRMRSMLDIGLMLLTQPTRENLNLSHWILAVKPGYTMVTNKNLVNLYHLAQLVCRSDLEGDIVECGVWNGGSAALMGKACHELGGPRRIWLFDSFSGLPTPTLRDGAIAQQRYFVGRCKGDQHMVNAAFGVLDVPQDGVTIVPGWFDDTLPQMEIGEIALLHIDADWYASVKVVLDNLYDQVVPGGFIVFDDYGYWEGCRQAVTEFFSANRLDPLLLKMVSRTGVYFQKPRP